MVHLYKGSILRHWGKKQAVALHTQFFDTLPTLEHLEPAQADMAWLIYDLGRDKSSGQFQLSLEKIVYTSFEPSLNRITKPERGDMTLFLSALQSKLDEKLDSDGNAPDAPTLNDLL